MLLTNNALDLMMLLPFYDFIHRKGILCEPNYFVSLWNKANMVIYHVTFFPRRVE